MLGGINGHLAPWEPTWRLKADSTVLPPSGNFRPGKLVTGIRKGLSLSGRLFDSSSIRISSELSIPYPNILYTFLKSYPLTYTTDRAKVTPVQEPFMTD